MLCSLTRESKKEKDVEKKKVQLADNVEQPSEAGMMCFIDGKHSGGVRRFVQGC